MLKSKNLFTLFVFFLILIEVSLIFITLFVDFEEREEPTTWFLEQQDTWVDTTLKQMSLEEKVGQLFLLELERAKSDFKEKTDTLFQEFHLSGIKFKKTEILNQLITTNYLQSKSAQPLFVSSEGSIINRTDFNLPIGAIINATNDSTFTEYYLDQFIKVLNYSGINLEFSNTIDVLDTVNLTNGFSDNWQLVAKQSKKLRQELQKNKIISCLNHNDKLFFNPDTAAIDTLCKLQQPFAINKYFALKMPSSINQAISSNKVNYNFSEFYKKHYGFKGLIFSRLDSSQTRKELTALFESGVDVFIVKGDVGSPFNKLKNLVNDGVIDEKLLDEKVKRVLLAKSWLKPQKKEFKSAEINLSKILRENRMLLSWNLYKTSLCLLKNENNTLPFSNLTNNRTHLLIFGNNKLTEFKEKLGYYMDFTSSVYDKTNTNSSSLRYSKNLILAIGDNKKNYFTDSVVINSLQQLSKYKRLIVVNFGCPETVKSLSFANAIISAYDDHPFNQANTAQLIAGAVAPKGKMLPQSLAANFKTVHFSKINRFKYTIPEAVGFNSYQLQRIDSIIEQAIQLEATPGAQVLAAKNGKVFFYKSYGYQTYFKRRKVKNTDLYDLASITKAAATTLAAMKLYEIDSIGLNDSIKYYIDDTIDCTIKNHQLADFFIHKTGMPPDMPILQYISYKDSVTKRYDKYYAEKKDSVHTIKLADNYYLREDYLDSVTTSLYKLEIDTTKPYLYSDINFNIIYDILLRKLPVSYKKFVYSNFYQPLQLRTTCFQPLDRFNKQRIAPTQKDRYWRKQLLRGTPHDESAALYGGIAGNAGLFSNANDLAILFQMLNNGGTYAGRKIFDEKTIEKFIYPQENSKRGLGFSRKKGGYYGHSGFTGCVVWANPQTDFIFVFLSNSIHPRATNRKLKRMKIRSKVLDLIWDAYEPGGLKLDFTSKD